jgi:choline transport protein
MIVVAHPDFVIQTWQTSLMAWAIVLLAIFCNTVLFRKLPLIEGVVMTLHVFGFFAFIIVLW